MGDTTATNASPPAAISDALFLNTILGPASAASLRRHLEELAERETGQVVVLRRNHEWVGVDITKGDRFDKH